MLRAAFIAVLIAYAPGALAYRLPGRDRDARASLSAEERVFWAIAGSIALSSLVAFGLAVTGAYRLDRLLVINGVISLGFAFGARRTLSLRPPAPRPGLTAVAPALLVALAVVVFFAVPPSEYVMGGRDPGVYMNEGIQITQRGSLVVSDPVIRDVPYQWQKFRSFDPNSWCRSAS